MSGTKYRIVLSELAALDLADILQYTLETWGAAQMDVYAAKLEKGLRLLETNPRLGKLRKDWYPGCRCYQVEQHLALYVVAQDEMRIARLFHARVDVVHHLRY